MTLKQRFTDTMTAIRQRAEWNAQAAERVGVVWGIDEPSTNQV